MMADSQTTTDISDQPASQKSEPVLKTVSLSKLKSMHQNVEQRRTLLGQSWDELQIALAQYHASLVVRQEQFEMLNETDAISYIQKLENELDRRQLENQKLQSSLSEVETKLAAVQEKNVCLTTDNEKLRDEVRIKQNLIEKLQNQMSRESMEYSAEIGALKESLAELSAAAGPSKRARLDEPAVSVQKAEATPSCMLESSAPPAKSDAAPAFSVATMPHLALATTSTEALETQNDVRMADYDVSNDVNRGEANVPLHSQNGEQFTVKEEVIDVDDNSSCDSLRLTEHDVYNTNLLEVTTNTVEIPDQVSVEDHELDETLREQNRLMSRPFGAPDLDEDLAPIQIEKFRLPTGVIAMAPTLNATPPKIHHCPYCYRHFDKSMALREHLKIHLGTHMYECKNCSRKFTQKGNLERHQRSVHKEPIPKKDYKKRNRKPKNL